MAEPVCWLVEGDQAILPNDFIHDKVEESQNLGIQYLSKESDILFCSITHANLSQFSKPGTYLESAGLEVFKTPPTCAISPSFH